MATWHLAIQSTNQCHKVRDKTPFITENIIDLWKTYLHLCIQLMTMQSICNFQLLCCINICQEKALYISPFLFYYISYFYLTHSLVAPLQKLEHMYHIWHKAFLKALLSRCINRSLAYCNIIHNTKHQKDIAQWLDVVFSLLAVILVSVDFTTALQGYFTDI